MLPPSPPRAPTPFGHPVLLAERAAACPVSCQHRAVPSSSAQWRFACALPLRLWHQTGNRAKLGAHRGAGSRLPAWDLADSWLQHFPICQAGYFGAVPVAEFLPAPTRDGNRSSRNHNPSPQHMRSPGKRHQCSATAGIAARVRHTFTGTVSGQAREAGSGRAGSRWVVQEQAGKQ